MRYPDHARVVSYLRRWSQGAFEGLLNSLDDLSDPQAWWRLKPELSEGEEYLHSSGSILGLVLHVASCKVMYAEYAFHDSALRWRDMADRARKAEPHLKQAIDWLNEAQDLWMGSWADLSDADLETPRRTNWGEMWPTERIITAMIHHDIHHTGQIYYIRALLPEDLTDVLPVSEADLWDRYLS
ncbi:MAG: DinB family protein [Candidatus Bipolaricaulia bacterium]